MMISDLLLLLPFPSVSLSNSYGVTFNTSQMIKIFSETGFVFFRFQSLIPHNYSKQHHSISLA